MLITKTVTKKILETIVQETFSKFGVVSSSSLLDSLKLLGFYYATNAGISINIEDLKTPDVKRKFIQTANDEIQFVSEQWQQGFVSDTERFQSIIDSWNVATESLKNRIVDYYQNFDPANNLYIMAFSGARGNMSQVRQLVGLRGLMSDQEGRIIDLPIQANFREGLSSIDYIISSYGARKGIVDTALKTADSGYLTRRLIYIAQDLIIRETDCQTTNGVIFLLNKNSNVKNLVGRVLISQYNGNLPFSKSEDQPLVLTESLLNQLKRQAPLVLNLRSSLTCESSGSICQKCYGWDLAHNKFITLGEAVGIIAAQSIGEPGTQLTMRTFHTGGIFTGETLRQVRAPFSGTLILPSVLKTIVYRTNHGMVVKKLLQEATVKIINWKGQEKEIFLDIGSFLYVQNFSFIKQNELISEYSTQSIIPGERKLKPISTISSGEIRFEGILVRNILKNRRKIKVNNDDGVLWISSGKIFPLPKEIKYLSPKYLNINKPLAVLKLVTPYSGIVCLKEKTILIDKNKKINIQNLSQIYKNSDLKISFSIKNYQYVDKGTVLGYLEIFPKVTEKVYVTRQKTSKNFRTLFIIGESDVWKVNSDQVNNFNFLSSGTNHLIRRGNSLNKTSFFSQAGVFLKNDGLKMIFQKANPVFLSRGTILNYKQGDFVFENQILASLVNYKQQTEDIVQGLPKIEEIIEARRPKFKAFLSERPGIILRSSTVGKNSNGQLTLPLNTKEKNPQILVCELEKSEGIMSTKKDKQLVTILHSIPSNFKEGYLLFWQNQIFRQQAMPKLTAFATDKDKVNLLITNLNYLSEKEKTYFKMTEISDLQKTLNPDKIYAYIDHEVKELDNVVIEEIEKNLILTTKKSKLKNNERPTYSFQTFDKAQTFYEKLSPVYQYDIPISLKSLSEPGAFVDLGEPLTEGIIDVHELLTIFFKYHVELDGLQIGVLRALNKFQLLLVNSIQAIYQSQGVNISSKHIEIIVRQMTANVLIIENGDTPFIPGELIRLSLIRELHKSFTELSQTNKIRAPRYKPTLMSTTNSSLLKDGFLSAAGFQETKRMLSKAAVEGTTDWLRGLKESVIIGRVIPAGSSFLNYKSYLDNIYLFKYKN